MPEEVKGGQVRSSRRGEIIYVITDCGLFNAIKLVSEDSGETIYRDFLLENKERIEHDFPIVAKADISISVNV